MDRPLVFGFVGSIFMALGITPIVGGYLLIVGLAFTLTALVILSRRYGNPMIMRNAIIGIVSVEVGIVVLSMGIDSMVTTLLHTTYIVTSTGTFVASPNYSLSLASGTVAILVFYITLVIYGVYIRRAYGELARLCGVNYFVEAGRWYLIGAVTTIVVVGVMLLIIANAYAALGFKNLM